jgi:(2S)-methylsuccinyl-CoA dehydrogenase
MYAVGRLMARGEGALEASMVKAYACRTAEWVTRETMQIHGGMVLRPLFRRFRAW